MKLRKSIIIIVAILSVIGTMLYVYPVSAIDLSSPTTWVEDPWGVTIIDKSSDPDAWDGKAVDNAYIYEEGGIYYAFYEGEDKYGHEQIGLASSTDFLTWTKLSVNNPILAKGGAVTWESKRVKIPVVTKHLDTYYLFYTGGNESGYMGIGLATSTDMLHWTKHSGNPVIPRVPSTWENHISTATNILEVAGTYWMFYRGFTSHYVNQKIGIAT